MQTGFSILKGAAGSGKSQTIRELFEMLSAREHKVEAIWPGLRTEICHVLKIGGLTIGIISMGDNLKIIRERLKWLRKYNCDFIFCTSRPSRESVKNNTSLIHELFGTSAQLHWVEKKRAAEGSLHKAENRADAKALLAPLNAIQLSTQG